MPAPGHSTHPDMPPPRTWEICRCRAMLSIVLDTKAGSRVSSSGYMLHTLTISSGEACRRPASTRCLQMRHAAQDSTAQHIRWTCTTAVKGQLGVSVSVRACAHVHVHLAQRGYESKDARVVLASRPTGTHIHSLLAVQLTFWYHPGVQQL